jgi:hypothetical protein
MMSVFRDTSLIMECPKCETINYLDPFTFWNFKGKIKCAGCDAIWAYELVAGTRTGPPAAAQGPHDKMPGYAQTKDWKKITDHTKVNKGPQAREDFQGKPITVKYVHEFRGDTMVTRLVGFTVDGKEQPEETYQYRRVR